MKGLVIGCVLIALAAVILNYETSEGLPARLGAAALLILGLFFLVREK